MRLVNGRWKYSNRAPLLLTTSGYICQDKYKYNYKLPQFYTFGAKMGTDNSFLVWPISVGSILDMISIWIFIQYKCWRHHLLIKFSQMLYWFWVVAELPRYFYQNLNQMYSMLGAYYQASCDYTSDNSEDMPWIIVIVITYCKINNVLMDQSGYSLEHFWMKQWREILFF